MDETGDFEYWFNIPELTGEQTDTRTITVQDSVSYVPLIDIFDDNQELDDPNWVDTGGEWDVVNDTLREPRFGDSHLEASGSSSLYYDRTVQEDEQIVLNQMDTWNISMKRSDGTLHYAIADSDDIGDTTASLDNGIYFQYAESSFTIASKDSGDIYEVENFDDPPAGGQWFDIELDFDIDEAAEEADVTVNVYEEGNIRNSQTIGISPDAFDENSQLSYDIVQLSLDSDNGVPEGYFDGAQYSYEAEADILFDLIQPEDGFSYELGDEPNFNGIATAPEGYHLSNAAIYVVKPDGTEDTVASEIGGSSTEELEVEGTYSLEDEQTGDWEWGMDATLYETGSTQESELRTFDVSEESGFADIVISEPEGEYPETVLSEGLTYKFNVDGEDNETNIGVDLEFPDGEEAGVVTYLDQDVTQGGGIDYEDEFVPNQILPESAEPGEYIFKVQATDSEAEQIVTEEQSFTVQEASFNAVFDLLQPEEDEVLETVEGEDKEVQFNATGEADVEATFTIRLNLEDQQIMVDQKTVEPNQTAELGGTQELGVGTYAWEVVAEDVETGETVSSGEQGFTVSEETLPDLVGDGISRIIGIVTGLDESIRNELDTGGQFLFATLLVTSSAVLVHLITRSDALTLLYAVLGVFGFSVTEGYYPTSVALIIAAFAAGIGSYFIVKGFSGGGR